MKAPTANHLTVHPGTPKTTPDSKQTMEIVKQNNENCEAKQ
jgi:hypothetical protein